MLMKIKLIKIKCAHIAGQTKSHGCVRCLLPSYNANINLNTNLFIYVVFMYMHAHAYVAICDAIRTYHQSLAWCCCHSHATNCPIALRYLHGCFVASDAPLYCRCWWFCLGCPNCSQLLLKLTYNRKVVHKWWERWRSCWWSCLTSPLYSQRFIVLNQHNYARGAHRFPKWILISKVILRAKPYHTVGSRRQHLSFDTNGVLHLWCAVILCAPTRNFTVSINCHIRTRISVYFN